MQSKIRLKVWSLADIQIHVTRENETNKKVFKALLEVEPNVPKLNESIA